MSAGIIIFICLVLFFAGFLTGITSFGGNMLSIPLFMLVMGTKEAIVFGCISGVAILAGTSLAYVRKAAWKDVCVLGFSSLAGVPAGIWILIHAGAKAILLGTAAVLAIFLVWQYFSPSMRKSQKVLPIWTGVPLGMISGAISGAVGMGGAPLALYAYLRRFDKECAVSTLSLAFFFQCAIIVPMLWRAGMLNAEFAGSAILYSLFSLLGIAVSIPLLHRLNIRVFRALLLGMIGISAVILLARGLMM